MATKLLLVQDVEDLGRSGDIVSVRPGYGRNYLLPQGKAVMADKRALRMQARLQEERKKKAAEDRKEAEKMAKSFENLVLETVVKVDREGHMYGSVSVMDILHLLEEKLKSVVEKKFVLLKHPIKALGEHKIDLKLFDEVPAAFTLKVVPEGEAVQPE